MDNQLLYFSFDGDGIGIHHAEAILSDDVENINNVSSQITAANEMVKDFVESNNGRMVSFGGDEGLFEAPADFTGLLEQLRKDYFYMVNATLSIGYGTKPSEAGKALLAAKEWGKDQVVEYDDKVEQTYQKLQESRDSESNSKADSSGQVLPTGADSAQNEPTLCEPPIQDNNKGYDSGYNNSDPNIRDKSYHEQDLFSPTIGKPNLNPTPPIEEAVCADVPESNRLMNNELPDPQDKQARDKKQAPKDYHGQAEGDSPNSSAVMGNRPSDIKYSPDEKGIPEPDMPTENATSDAAEETEESNMLGDDGHCPGCNCKSKDNSIDGLMDQHVDNAQDLESTFSGSSNKEGDEVENVLDQHIQNASDMQNEMDGNGVSRPEDYDEKDEDMGLSEDEAMDGPNLEGVLKNGLDSHADNIKREKTINMVGEALEAFKGQKKILDKAKEQAPELYDACLSMLRAMIGLCSLAGIDESQAEQDVNQIEGQKPQEESSEVELLDEQPHSEESCPTCGKTDENKAAPGGAASFPKK